MHKRGGEGGGWGGARYTWGEGAVRYTLGVIDIFWGPGMHWGRGQLYFFGIGAPNMH